MSEAKKRFKSVARIFIIVGAAIAVCGGISMFAMYSTAFSAFSPSASASAMSLSISTTLPGILALAFGLISLTVGFLALQIVSKGGTGYTVRVNYVDVNTLGKPQKVATLKRVFTIQLVPLVIFAAITLYMSITSPALSILMIIICVLEVIELVLAFAMLSMTKTIQQEAEVEQRQDDAIAAQKQQEAYNAQVAAYSADVVNAARQLLNEQGNQPAQPMQQDQPTWTINRN